MSKRKRAKLDDGSRLIPLKKKGKSELSTEPRSQAPYVDSAGKIPPTSRKKKQKGTQKLESDKLDRPDRPDEESTRSRAQSRKDSRPTSAAPSEAGQSNGVQVSGETAVTNGPRSGGIEPSPGSHLSGWEILGAGGGYLLNLDPVLSFDEE